MISQTEKNIWVKKYNKINCKDEEGNSINATELSFFLSGRDSQFNSLVYVESDSELHCVCTIIDEKYNP